MCGKHLQITKKYIFLTSDKAEVFIYAVVRLVTIAVNQRGVQKMAAFDLNATLGPIIDGVVNLMPSFLALIVAIVPVIITIAVLKFVVSFLGKIIDLLNI